MSCRIDGEVMISNCPYAIERFFQTGRANLVSHCVALATACEPDSGITKDFVGEECPEEAYVKKLKEENAERIGQNA